jgi:hypothetical protein
MYSTCLSDIADCTDVELHSSIPPKELVAESFGTNRSAQLQRSLEIDAKRASRFRLNSARDDKDFHSIARRLRRLPQAEARNGDSLSEVNRHRKEKGVDCFIGR